MIFEVLVSLKLENHFNLTLNFLIENYLSFLLELLDFY